MQVNIKPNYIVFSLITLIVSMVSRFYTSTGMRWYYTLNLPSYTPANWVIGTVWSIIYVLTTVAVIMVWNNVTRDKQFYAILALFMLNALLHVLWTYLFFYKQNITLALADAVALFASLLALVVAVGQRSLFLASLLAPYLAWVTFAVWLNFAILMIN